MIVEFSLGNYKSYKDVKVLSLTAANDKEHITNNVHTIEIPYGQKHKTFNILKSAVIYGANASGKSNLLDGLLFMQAFIMHSSKNMQINEDIPIEPCLVSAEAENEPSFFEIIFYFEDVLYRYGFEVTTKAVVSEWLFYTPKGVEVKLFIRDKNNFDLGHSFKEGKGLEQKTRQNALFLSVCAQFNSSRAKTIFDWFKRLNVISGLEDKQSLPFTLNKLEDPNYLPEIEHFIKQADIGIEKILFEQKNIKLADVPEAIKTHLLHQIEGFKPGSVQIQTIEQSFRFIHSKYDKEENVSSVSFTHEKESQGTQKLFAIAGPILDTLKFGKTLFIDELDTRLHPLLTQYIIKLFNSKEMNKKNAQLIFATHDINLLSNRFFRRDQIWFTEKNRFNVTDLYSLSDFKVRKDATFNKDYIMGKYGAIPYINNLHSSFFEEDTHENE